MRGGKRANADKQLTVAQGVAGEERGRRGGGKDDNCGRQSCRVRAVAGGDADAGPGVASAEFLRALDYSLGF